MNLLTVYVHQSRFLYMNTNEISEVRFTAKRASIWNRGNMRWQGIARDKAQALIALGLAVDLTDAEWV